MVKELRLHVQSLAKSGAAWLTRIVPRDRIRVAFRKKGSAEQQMQGSGWPCSGLPGHSGVLVLLEPNTAEPTIEILPCDLVLRHCPVCASHPYCASPRPLLFTINRSTHGLAIKCPAHMLWHALTLIRQPQIAIYERLAACSC